MWTSPSVVEETKNTLEEFVMAGYPSGGANLTAGVLEAMNRFQMNALEMNSQRNGANTPCNNVSAEEYHCKVMMHGVRAPFSSM